VLAPDKSIDRKKLSAALQAKRDISQEEATRAFALLESIVHPLVTRDRQEFIAQNSEKWLCAVDIPLLYETMPDPREHGVDKVLVVSCSSEEQRRRALKRPNMSEDKLAAILKRQLSNDDRTSRADFLVDTSHADKAAAKHQLAQVIERLYRVPDRRPSAEIRCVSLDLDDTLWPTKPAIEAVAATSAELLPTLLPKTAEALNGENPYACVIDRNHPRSLVKGDDARLAHDFTSLRRLALRTRALEHGDPLENVETLVEAIVETRSRVAVENLLPCALHVVDEIRSLPGNLTVGALTNGNARPKGHLADSLDFWLGAPDVGAQKPSIAAFLAASARSDAPLASIVHVGDSIRDDVLGALHAGARAILVPRADGKKPTDDDVHQLLKDFDPRLWAVADSLQDVPAIISRWLQQEDDSS